MTFTTVSALLRLRKAVLGSALLGRFQTQVKH
jgi:hypothetical protein